ncbi:biopolymer transporter ExbD [Robbsia sp. Bb-Pol-6]|uniref:Biopolymer transporter ExbD n=1 Tax=Robbsia betulipollinis TaxID=2981849 RepID=A0ABT3ZRH8_9BURK|nr:biopolymer transporter ExbD [Robbsia betulipollinis]MCY0388877.1 biopolymer transporter ExbD [Robbsia betulipollinis]
MAFGSFDPASRQARPPVLAEINMTPLIDVMLVLLVIFILAAPLFARSLALDLPKAQVAAVPPSTAPVIALAIDRAGRLSWNGTVITTAELARRLRDAAALTPQPDIAFSADRTTPYQRITDVMAAAQRAGMSRFGFVVAGGG